jgi:hypothetical protein
MADWTCDVCGAPDPRWVWHIDRTLTDFHLRVGLGMPGPTVMVVWYCDAPECEAEVRRRHGPQGNAAAARRIMLDQLARQQEARS